MENTRYEDLDGSKKHNDGKNLPTLVGVGGSLTVIIMLLYNINTRLDSVYEHLIFVETQQKVHEEETRHALSAIRENRDGINDVMKFLYEQYREGYNRR